VAIAPKQAMFAFRPRPCPGSRFCLHRRPWRVRMRNGCLMSGFFFQLESVLAEKSGRTWGAEAEGAGAGRRQGSLTCGPRGVRLGPLRQLLRARRSCSALPQTRHRHRCSSLARPCHIRSARRSRMYSRYTSDGTAEIPKSPWRSVFRRPSAAIATSRRV
jgi:hypothetical protein